MEQTVKKNGFLEKMRNLFGGVEMTWMRVILLAVAAGVLTAVFNLIPALKDTSFQDIAVNVECWILFAVFIIVNCKNWKEAALKCFVFFLISQPLVYLIEAPFLGWGVFSYYKYWFIITLLTLPGAVIAYQLKRKDWLSVAVLSVANAYLAYMGVKYFKTSLARFPHHLLSAVFCIALALFFIFVFFDKKQHRLAALAVVALTLIITGAIAVKDSGTKIPVEDSDWTVTIADESVAGAEVKDGNLVVKAKGDGLTDIYLDDSEGNHLNYIVTVTGGNVFAELYTDGTYYASDSDMTEAIFDGEDAVG